MLRRMRGRDGGPHAGMKLLALVLALLLAAPLTFFLWDVGSAVLGSLY